MTSSRDQAATERDRSAWRRDRAAEARDVRASARDRRARDLHGDADQGFADRFLSARDADDAAGDRAAALADRDDARRDREDAVAARGGDAAVPPPVGPGAVLDGLDRRRLIWQGQGVLMSRRGISANEAFELLVETAHHRDLPMQEVADELVHGTTPAPDATG